MEIENKPQGVWYKSEFGNWLYKTTEAEDRVYLSYKPKLREWRDYDNSSQLIKNMIEQIEKLETTIDEEESAICIKGADRVHFYILNGDHRAELAPLYPDIEKLKAYFKANMKDKKNVWSEDLEVEDKVE